MPDGPPRRPVSPLLGILGGMGPLATAHFYRRVIERTPAVVDQEHIPVLIWADPRMPDRSTALLGEGPSPLPWLTRGALGLQRAGASVVAIPCNTAHAYARDIASRTGIEIVDMIAASLRDATASGAQRVGLLATRGTRAARLYERAAVAHALEIVLVSEELQRDLVDPLIASIKSGRSDAASQMDLLVAELEVLGAEAVILGCSELPLACGDGPFPLPLIDSATSLADASISRMIALERAARA